jgi:hypothetical protein
MQPARVSSCISKTGHQMRYSLFIWHRRIDYCIVKFLVPSYERTRWQAVLDNVDALQLRRVLHKLTATLERHLTDWGERVAALRDLRGLLYSHSGTVCVC